MVPSRSAERPPRLGPEERTLALEQARGVIRHQVVGEAPRPWPSPLPEGLAAPGASFVTLHLEQQLFGCMGTLEAWRSLAEDIESNAYAAAFRDPRARPLRAPEVELLSVHISVLGPTEPLPAASEKELLSRLQPGEDGLVLYEGSQRATFLPAVWETLPEPAQFLAALKRKAGLPASYWSRTLRFARYGVEAFP
ncbi:MAG TPA: AmmeMemoRadiSam system protein A [Thermoanaerobaculia bacterium]|nr:AmmeMemoRadiSam system protein A [Thermoanaerobaculia bacterium]